MPAFWTSWNSIIQYIFLMSGYWKKKVTGWEHILALHISDKEPVPEYILNTNKFLKVDNPILKWTKDYY